MRNIIIIVLCLMAFQFSFGQNLESYIQEALENNPTIQKFELKHQQIQEKVNEVNTIPNTEFGAGYFVGKPETRVGAQDFKLSAKQLFPWFGTITSRENYANSLAEVSYEDIVIAQRKLVSEIYQSYYNLYTLKEKDKIVDENLALLQVYEIMALASVESGKATVVQVLRIQTRENELMALKQELLETYEAEKTVFAKLLNRNHTEGILVVDTLTIPKKETVLLDSLSIHPELLKFDKLYASVEKSELLNMKEKAPMVGVGLDYISVSERTDVTITDNGKDIFMPMVTVSIPIFNKKYSSKTKQNELAQKEILVQKTERQNELETMLSKVMHERTAARVNYEIQIDNIVKTKSAEEILIKKYETENIDFYEVLDLQQLQLKFQMNQVEALRKYYRALTIMNYLSVVK